MENSANATISLAKGTPTASFVVVKAEDLVVANASASPAGQGQPANAGPAMTPASPQLIRIQAAIVVDGEIAFAGSASATGMKSEDISGGPTVETAA